MALYQRISPAASSRGNGSTDISPDRSGIKQPTTKYQLFKASELPSWYAHNTYLHTGYRPVTGSVERCIDSLLHIHNETVNIYSHLIPAAAAVVSNFFLHVYFQHRYSTAPLADRLAVHTFLTSSIICFGISSAYHTLNCHSEAYSDLWAIWDYASIIVQTIGSFCSGIYVTFYCHPGLQKFYWTVVSLIPLYMKKKSL